MEAPMIPVESTPANGASTDTTTTATHSAMHDGNPAHLLCASQLLRLKRTHEDQEEDGGAHSSALPPHAPSSTPNPPPANRNQVLLI